MQPTEENTELMDDIARDGLPKTLAQEIDATVDAMRGAMDVINMLHNRLAAAERELDLAHLRIEELQGR